MKQDQGILDNISTGIVALDGKLKVTALNDYVTEIHPQAEGFVRTLEVLRQECGPDRLITFARAVSTPDQRIVTVSLGEATPDMADMRTVVIVGNSATRRVGRFVYSPRSAR